MSGLKSFTVRIDERLYERLVMATERHKPRLPKRYAVELALERLLDALDGRESSLHRLVCSRNSRRECGCVPLTVPERRRPSAETLGFTASAAYAPQFARSIRAIDEAARCFDAGFRSSRAPVRTQWLPPWF